MNIMIENKILLLTDNQELLNRFKVIVQNSKFITSKNYVFEYAYSYNNKTFSEKYINSEWIKPLKVKEKVAELVSEYDLIISLHCKQLFPAELVKKVRCINVHPGLNPFNRGWFPQVFSILNGLPCGATVHEIDEYLDHGAVICQKEVKIEIWDTSLSAYNKILDVEIELLEKHIEKIINHDYKTQIKNKGNLNLKKDFDDLCEIKLDNKDSFLNHINRLRALTHGDYSNAYFFDENGKKIYLTVELKKV
jgi:dTDP-4-amino-4,6-dideoxyglucose formyltransferase